MAETLVAVYDTHARAVEGVQELRRRGVDPEQISIFAPDPRELEGFGDEIGVRVVEAGATGILAGGVLGGAAGWLLGATGLLVPGAGLIIAAGPLVGAVVGAVGGATVGGFVGILVGMGLPSHAAEEYTRQLQSGRTLVFVHPNGDPTGVEAALAKAHPIGLHHYDERLGTELAQGAPSTISHAALRNPTEHVEPAQPDASLSPADVSASIEGQRVMGHTQYLDEADLHPTGGKKDV
ncbi:MAG: hypothetical protein ACK47B_28630 [Armatimonadota bacterium]